MRQKRRKNKKLKLAYSIVVPVSVRYIDHSAFLLFYSPFLLSLSQIGEVMIITIQYNVYYLQVYTHLGYV